jgi:hypothetical protein
VSATFSTFCWWGEACTMFKGKENWIYDQRKQQDVYCSWKGQIQRKTLQSRNSRVLDLLCHWLKQSPLCLAQGLYQYHYESTNAHLHLNIHMSATSKQLPGSGRKKQDGQGKKQK